MAGTGKYDSRVLRAPWHAVSITPCKNACTASKALHDQRYLPQKAPRLPLPECAQPGDCTCTYQHHADRRAGPRRITNSGPKSPEAGTPVRERRRPGERRSRGVVKSPAK